MSGAEIVMRDSELPPKQTWRIRILALMILGIAGTLCVYFWYGPSSKSAFPASVTAKERELARKSYLLENRHEPEQNDLLFILAESYMATNKLNEALDCLSAIPTSAPKYGRLARYHHGRVLLALHRAPEAEKQARELIALEEAAPQIKPNLLINLRQGLRHILEVELRFEERHQLLKGVIARREATGFDVFAGCFPSHLPWNGSHAVKWIEEFYSETPEDQLIRIALGRYLTGRGDLAEAQRILQEVSREFPDDLRATAALIACAQEADDTSELKRLMDSLPPQSPHDPWLLLLQRGSHALENGMGKEATFAYEEVLKQDPTSNQAWHGLARAAQLTGDPRRREHAIKMATGLGRILNKLAKGIERVDEPNSFLDVADVCAEIDLNQEGMILSEFASGLDPANPRVVKSLAHFKARLNRIDGSQAHPPIAPATDPR